MALDTVNPEQINRVGIVGAGLMGHSIALEFAAAGYDVSLHSRTQTSLDRALAEIRLGLDKLVQFDLLSPECREKAPERIRATTVLERAVEGADLVVESVFEDVELKRQIFERLDRACPEHTILASNTSSLMPSAFTPDTERAARTLVSHYINPPYLIPLVEIVPTARTSSETVDTVTAVLTRMGKRPIVVRKEVPGFILNRLQGALIREALWMVESGIATPQDVDISIKGSLGRRWAVAGIFEIFDIAGWDVVEAISSAVMPHLTNASETSPVLKKKVADGELGAKSGKGFYEWSPETTAAMRQRIARALVEIEKWESDQE